MPSYIDCMKRDWKVIAAFAEENPAMGYRALAEHWGTTVAAMRDGMFRYGINRAGLIKNGRPFKGEEHGDQSLNEGKGDTTMTSTIADSMRESVVKAIRENPDETLVSISKRFQVKYATVQLWSRAAGIVKMPGRVVCGSATKTVNSLAETNLERSIREKEAELARLKNELAKREIRFERINETIIVHGITDRAFQANYSDWLRFLTRGGASKLREFIVTEMNQAKRTEYVVAGRDETVSLHASN
jgi:hypothetical protein